MEALAQYRATVPTEKVIDLKVRVTAPTRNLAELWDINNNNAYLQRSNSKKVSPAPWPQAPPLPRPWHAAPPLPLGSRPLPLDSALRPRP